MDIVTRAMGVLMDPKKEWGTIAGESSDPGKLFIGYLIPLLVLQAVAQVLGALIFGGFLRIGIMVAVMGLITSLIIVGVVGFVAAKLASMFGGKDDLTQGMKLVIYSMTPSIIAGAVVGFLAFLGTIGAVIVLVAVLYGIYILYLGVTPTVSVPADKSIIYIVALIVVAIVVAIVISFIVGMLGLGMGGMALMRGM